MLFLILNKRLKNETKEKPLQTAYEEATKMYEADPTDLNQNRLNEAKEVLELFYEEKTKGIIIRARARWHEHGERNTKYFLNLEKRNNVNKHIRKLLVSGAITTNPYKILDEQKRFYHDLYKSRCTNMDLQQWKNVSSNLNIPKLQSNHSTRDHFGDRGR